ncbi:MAG TPA: acetylornithine deacetylase [Tabrizicola sp.]|nr:acetylornithine deacetylase [Tabrizicola sp.]
MKVSENQEGRILSILEALVGFDTESSKSNLEAIGWIEGYARQYPNVRSQRYLNYGKDKAALVIQVGPEAAGGVVLSSHIDVVPVIGQAWDQDPFSLVRKGDRVFGRGTCDMKGFIAVALAAIPELSAGNLVRPVQIVVSYDEEIGCLGAPVLLEGLNRDFPRAANAVVGEPTGMKPVIGHKGVLLSETRVTGYEVHSSLMHRGVSAIHTASWLISWHDQQNDLARETASAFAFDPPFSTFHVGIINGGTASNITARDCRFVSDWRLLPEFNEDVMWKTYESFVESVEARIRKIADSARVDVVKGAFTPPLNPTGTADGFGQLSRVLGNGISDVVSYGTEAGHFQRSGYNTVICGPGSIEQAHQENEFIEVSELTLCAGFVADLAEMLSQ